VNDRCARCRRAIDKGSAIARHGTAFHVRCLVFVMLAEPRGRPMIAQRVFRELVPMGAR
jgi:hypothetical protein